MTYVNTRAPCTSSAMPGGARSILLFLLSWSERFVFFCRTDIIMHFNNSMKKTNSETCLKNMKKYQGPGAYLIFICNVSKRICNFLEMNRDTCSCEIGD